MGAVSANSEYCSPTPNTKITSIDHQGSWWNITISSPDCFVCTDNGGGYGDVDCVPCVASAFRANVTCGIVPFAVQFNDTSSDPTIISYYWDFAVNNTTEKDPVQWYNLTGVYGVDHSTTNPSNTYWTNKTDYITARAPGDTCFGGSSSGGGGTSASTGGEVMWLVFGLVGGGVLILIAIRR